MTDFKSPEVTTVTLNNKPIVALSGLNITLGEYKIQATYIRPYYMYMSGAEKMYIIVTL